MIVELGESRPLLSFISGIVVSWNLELLYTQHAFIQIYQIFSREKIVGSVLSFSRWQKVGDINALPLPMACSLSQFSAGRIYQFVVRAIDVHGRTGPFSDPGYINL